MDDGRKPDRFRWSDLPPRQLRRLALLALDDASERLLVDPGPRAWLSSPVPTRKQAMCLPSGEKATHLRSAAACTARPFCRSGQR